MSSGGKFNSGSFVSTTSVKFNRSCPHCKSNVCTRQQKNCNNKDAFFENCIVFKGNNTLGLFMKQRKYFNANVPVIEEREEIKAEEKVEVVQEISIDIEASEN